MPRQTGAPLAAIRRLGGVAANCDRQIARDFSRVAIRPATQPVSGHIPLRRTREVGASAIIGIVAIIAIIGRCVIQLSQLNRTGERIEIIKIIERCVSHQLQLFYLNLGGEIIGVIKIIEQPDETRRRGHRDSWDNRNTWSNRAILYSFIAYISTKSDRRTSWDNRNNRTFHRIREMERVAKIEITEYRNNWNNWAFRFN